MGNQNFLVKVLNKILCLPIISHLKEINFYIRHVLKGYNHIIF